jgi:hypothetical protein
MLVEDLTQEAREAVIGQLRETPDCPDSYLVVRAKDAISRYRRKGSSVDGKLYPVHRTHHYQMVSLDAPVSHDGGGLREEVTRVSWGSRRPTEEIACARVLLDEFRDTLSTEERDCLSLRLMGIPWEEVEQHLGTGEGELAEMRKGMEEKALAFWERPDSGADYGRCRRRASGTRALLPPQLPPALLAVLSPKERQALKAYEQGATQTEAAREAELSQPTLSRLLAFLRDSCHKPPDDIKPRTTRFKNTHRREQFLTLFTSRPAGELVSHEELLESFADVQQPLQALRTAVSRYRRQIEGARITVVKGQGYALAEER